MMEEYIVINLKRCLVAFRCVPFHYVPWLLYPSGITESLQNILLSSPCFWSCVCGQRCHLHSTQIISVFLSRDLTLAFLRSSFHNVGFKGWLGFWLVVISPQIWVPDPAMWLRMSHQNLTWLGSAEDFRSWLWAFTSYLASQNILPSSLNVDVSLDHLKRPLWIVNGIICGKHRD